MPDIYWTSSDDWDGASSKAFVDTNNDSVTLDRTYYNDDFNTFESFFWELFGDAAHDSTNEEIDLAATGTGALFYTATYEQSSPFYGEADFNYDTGESYWFTFYGSRDDINTTSHLPNYGYHVHFDLAGGNIALEQSTGDSTARDTLRSMPYTFPASPFTARVTFDGESVTVSIDGEPVFITGLTNPDQTYSLLGWTADSGANDYAHSLDNAYIRESSFERDGTIDLQPKTSE